MIPKISVVVPIYCAEKYLSACVDSLLAQTLQEIEIILVDDGSPDGSGKLADDYAREDSRIKVIHQQNAGLGPARNAGMAIAEGEYIGFVDADDWVELDLYENLYRSAVQNHADIVASGHCDVAHGIVTAVKQHPLAGQTINDADTIREIRKNLYGHGLTDAHTETFPMSACMSIYKREMLQKNGIRFRKILSEDAIFNLSAYEYATVISFSGETAYYYRKEGQPSTTQSHSPEKRKHYADFLAALAQMAAEENDTDCALRVKRTAIDNCRLYVRQVDMAQATFREKVRYVREFAQMKEIAGHWDGYPTEALPAQQRILHWFVVHGFYGAALMLNRLRRKMGKGRGKSNDRKA